MVFCEEQCEYIPTFATNSGAYGAIEVSFVKMTLVLLWRPAPRLQISQRNVLETFLFQWTFYDSNMAKTEEVFDATL